MAVLLFLPGMAYGVDYYPQNVKVVHIDIDTCVQEAGNEYGIAPDIIWKLIRAESGGNVTAVNVDGRSYRGLPLRDAAELVYRSVRGKKSVDVGLMQINTINLKELGARDAVVLFNPCFNIKAGAYLLAKAMKKLGYSWSAIGAYNVGVAGMTGKSRHKKRYVKRGMRYARKVSRMSSKPFKAWVPIEVYGLIAQEDTDAADNKVD